MLALALAVQKQGDAVLFATHPNFESFVTGRGLAFTPIAGNPQELIQSEAVLRWLESYKDPIGFSRQMNQLAGEYADAMSTDIYRACQSADGIIFSPLAIPALDVGEKLDLPMIAAGLQPLTPTGAFNPMMLPLQFNPGYIINYLLHLVILQVIWRPMSGHINRFRRTLGLKPYNLRGPYVKRFLKDKIPVIYGFSPVLLPRPRDWPGNHHVTGYWFLDEKDSWNPPDGLESFIEQGSKPFYIGFGSMSPRDPRATTEIIMEALALSGQRGVLLSGWAGLDASDLPESVFRLENVPHDWLFPQMRGVIHHGGAGTTAAGLRAGVPQIIAPFFSDQPFWGQRIQAIGVGPAPIPQKQLTAQKLANAIQTVIESEDMTAKALSVGKAIHAEDGIENALNVIHSTFSGSKK
jgi:UDP:flavonoid glycosyltransferase YjiC (YdhE family)